MSIKTQKPINLFFIGEDFYWLSGTRMSSIYEEKTFKRYDWGFVSISLQRGKRVTLRPATVEEIKWAKKELIKYREGT